MINNPLAIASVSLGQHRSHTLPKKIAAAAQNGFAGLEITYPDLESFATSESCSMLDAANQVKDFCNGKGVRVISLAPFENFEGHTSPIKERLRKAEEWLGIARALGADYLQVPSTFDRTMNKDHDTIISELQQLSDLARASTPTIKVAYENMSWSHIALWQEALALVKEVDRDNFGLCLDSFHICTALWASPYNASGKVEDADENLTKSIRDLVKSCPIEKIFYVQLSDGERMDPPYSKEHPWYNPELAVEHVWSMHARPFPLETQYGAYMPVQQFTQALLLEKGFSGWVSLETFDRRMRKEENGPMVCAGRASKAWSTLQKHLTDVMDNKSSNVRSRL